LLSLSSFSSNIQPAKESRQVRRRRADLEAAAAAAAATAAAAAAEAAAEAARVDGGRTQRREEVCKCVNIYVLMLMLTTHNHLRTPSN
jgi:hypothetical protein